MFGKKGGKKRVKALPVTTATEMVEVLIQSDDEEKPQSNQTVASSGGGVGEEAKPEAQPLDNTQITLRVNCGDPGGAAESKKLRVQLLDGREWSSCDDACREAFRDLIKYLVVNESDDRRDRALQQRAQELLNYQPLSDGINFDLKKAIKKSKVLQRLILDVSSVLVHARRVRPQEGEKYITTVPLVTIDESRFGLSESDRPEGLSIPMYQWADLFALVRAEERSNDSIRWKQNAYGLAAGIGGVMLMCGVVMLAGVLSASAEYVSNSLPTLNAAISISSISLIGMVVCITLGCRHKTSGGKLAPGQRLRCDGKALVIPADFRFMEEKALDALQKEQEEKRREAEEKAVEEKSTEGDAASEGPNLDDGITL